MAGCGLAATSPAVETEAGTEALLLGVSGGCKGVDTRSLFPNFSPVPTLLVGEAARFRGTELARAKGEEEREFAFNIRCVTALEAALAVRVVPFRAAFELALIHFSKCVAYRLDDTCREHTRHSNKGLFE